METTYLGLTKSMAVFGKVRNLVYNRFGENVITVPSQINDTSFGYSIRFEGKLKPIKEKVMRNYIMGIVDALESI